MIEYLKEGCGIHFLYTLIYFQKIRCIEVSKFVIIYISLMNQVHIYKLVLPEILGNYSTIRKSNELWKAYLIMTFSHCQDQELKEQGFYLQMTSNIFSSQPWHIHQVENLFGANLCQTETICDGFWSKDKDSRAAMWLTTT